MMKRILLLWRLELKRTVKLLPAMMLEAVVILAVTCAIAICMSRLLYRDAPTLQVTIAVVEEEENPLTELALAYVQGMESISKICNFLMVTETEGFSMLQEGRAAALLILPGSMMEGILNGENLPVQVYFPEDAGIESALLKELTDAGVQMLRVAQAQIYGVYDTARAYGALDQLSVLEADIDRYNLAFALERLSLFQVEEVSATENLSIFSYAAASGITFFLLLLGMACYPMMQSDALILRRQLMRQGIGIGAQCVGKWLCGLCGMGLGLICSGVLARVLLGLSGRAEWMPQIGGKQIGICVLVLLCITTFTFMIFQLAGNGTAAILLLFLFSTVMLYFSGGFLPAVFLPETVRKIARFLPTTYLTEAVGSLYTGRMQGKTAWILMLFAVTFAIAAYGIAFCKVRKGAEA